MTLLKDLTADRSIEWPWCIKHLPYDSTVLDVGCCHSIISQSALYRRNYVTGIDLLDENNIKDPNFSFICDDFLSFSFPNLFDCIIACSTIEHIGLFGRYGSEASPDGDLLAIAKIKSLLKTGGTFILTIPLGKDAVFNPLHRVYGITRLPLILSGFEILFMQFWGKPNNNNWGQISSFDALSLKASPDFYNLGLYVLNKFEA